MRSSPLWCMNHLWMELESINSFLSFFNRCKRSILRMGDGVKSWRQCLDLIPMAHPDHQLTSPFPQAFEKFSLLIQRSISLFHTPSFLNG